MKSKMMTMSVAGLALVVGALLVAPHAEAVTKKKVATISASSTANYQWILGEDNAIWYTVTSPAQTTAKTGNSGNPIDSSGTTFDTSGFLKKSNAVCAGGVGSDSAATPCSAIWFKTPGAGSFQDAPTVTNFGPIVASSLSQTGTVGNSLGKGYPLAGTEGFVFNIVVPGQDNGVWYTLFDATGVGGGTNLVGGITASLAIGSNDPFVGAGENTSTVDATGTGFVKTSALSSNCSNSTSPITTGRTCVGIWVQMPQF